MRSQSNNSITGKVTLSFNLTAMATEALQDFSKHQGGEDSSDSEIEGTETRTSLKSPRKRSRGRKSTIEIDEFDGPLDHNHQLDVDELLSPDYDWNLQLKSCLEKQYPGCLEKRLDSDFFKVSDLEDIDVQNNQKEEFTVDLSTLELTRVVKHRRVSGDFQESGNEKSVVDKTEPQPSTSKPDVSDDSFKAPKPRCRKFIFKPFTRNDEGCLQHDDTKDPAEVVIPEQMAASYGLYLWPCAPVLAWYIWLKQDDIRGKNVLELGSGTALPGLLCSKIGASKVWLSDDSWQENTLKNIREAVKINAVEEKTETLPLTWGEYTEELFQFDGSAGRSLDFIIGSDLFFDPDVFEPLLITISYLLEDNQNAQVWIAVQERSSDWSIEEHLIIWKLKCSYIFPREFLRGTGIEEADLTGRHSIFILKIFREDSVHGSG